MNGTAVAPATGTGYIGRFAPSPTGPLHFGSLVAAAGSYLQALSAQGRWRLRIDDIDPPREVPGASRQIVALLDALRMDYTRPVDYQSARLPVYRDAVHGLLADGLAFRCRCSRASMRAEAMRRGLPPHRYPGTCRRLDLDPDDAPVVRARVDHALVSFDDGLAGALTVDLASSAGDFVIWRRGDLPAYQLAAAVDDHADRITEVVRGRDLLESTHRQIWLMQQLGLRPPHYVHLPVVTTRAGEKLSKQTGASPVRAAQASAALVAVLDVLGQAPPAALASAPAEDIWAWAQDCWSLAPLRSLNTLLLPPGFDGPAPS